MYSSIKNYCEERMVEFDQISAKRKNLLEHISQYIQQQIAKNETVKLMYVCTHNSRRSHFGQVWAKVAAHFFDITNIETYSGGTEATAFNPNAIAALQRVGFNISTHESSPNPTYRVQFGNESYAYTSCFSKVYNDPANPTHNFAAIMTCSDAEENCPYIPGVALRIATTYDDPKAFDGTPLQDAKYDERCAQIARECLYVFSKVNALK
jgi:protein-tyrosine phosphatase/arsenate reductase